MAYSPSIWPKVLAAIPAILIVGVLLGNGLNEQIERYENRAATAAAREAMRSCSREHGVEIAWQEQHEFATHNEFSIVGREVRYFSAVSPAEIAAAHCIIDALPDMARRSETRIVCIDETATMQVKRTVDRHHVNPPEENYSFFLSPCGDVERDNT